MNQDKDQEQHKRQSEMVLNAIE